MVQRKDVDEALDDLRRSARHELARVDVASRQALEAFDEQLQRHLRSEIRGGLRKGWLL